MDLTVFGSIATIIIELLDNSYAVYIAQCCREYNVANMVVIVFSDVL